MQLVNKSAINIVFARSIDYNATAPLDLESYKNFYRELGAAEVNGSDYYSSATSWEEMMNSYAEKKMTVFVLNKDSANKHAGDVQKCSFKIADIFQAWHWNLDSLEAHNWT